MLKSPPTITLPKSVSRSLAVALVALSAVVYLGAGCDAAPDSLTNGGTRGDTPAPSSTDGLNEPAGSPAPSQDGSFTDDDSAAPEAPADSDAGSVARVIEEADIVRVVDNRMYAVSRFKGLFVIDVADPDNPAVLGELDLRGRGVEMYVGDGQVYILLSADFYVNYDFAVSSGAEGEARDTTTIAPPEDSIAPPRPEFEGSQIAIIDVSDPTDPTVEGKLNLVGYANESRRVDDIIYVVGSNSGPYYALGAAEGEDDGDSDGSSGEGFIASINVADPTDIVAVDRKNLSGDALTMHVSETAIFAATRDYDFDRGESLTEMQVVDISDPDGAIVLRDAFTVPGSIRNRFYMDDFEGVFRVATESFGFGFPQVRLFTYDIADLDAVEKLGETQIIENESLEAVRFDGVRGYVVTFLSVDPLFVLDLSDPANPTVAGELEVPGFSTHLEPRGNRLIAVGIDDTDGNRAALAYYDVEDPANPVQIDRIILGPPGSYTTSDATYDEKAFKIIDELGLIAIPFQHIDWGDYGYGGGDGGSSPPSEPAVDVKSDEIAPDEYRGPVCTNGVQLVDFSDDGMTQRGSFENSSNVSRVGVIGDRVFALSDVSLKTVDISDRDNPTKAGEAMFFTDEEMEHFDECGGYLYPPFILEGPGGIIDDLNGAGIDVEAMIRMLSQNCGEAAPLPGAALLLCLCFTRAGLRRRFRRRR